GRLRGQKTGPAICADAISLNILVDFAELQSSGNKATGVVQRNTAVVDPKAFEAAGRRGIDGLVDMVAIRAKTGEPKKQGGTRGKCRDLNSEIRDQNSECGTRSAECRNAG